MATYGDNAREYPYAPQHRKKQRYSLVTRLINFTQTPITSGNTSGRGAGSGDGNSTVTAFAAADVLQVIQLRAGTTVLGVQVEILTPSSDTGDYIEVGFGSDTARWGRVDLYRFNRSTQTGMLQDGDVSSNRDRLNNMVWRERPGGLFGKPYYFSSADTIDIVIGKAALAGKIRVIAHILEDDR